MRRRNRYQPNELPVKSPLAGTYCPTALYQRGITAPFPTEVTDRWRKESRGRIPSGLQVRPQFVNHDSPEAIACVLDALLRLETNTEIRASNVTLFLKLEYPHLLWNAQTVGRIIRATYDLGLDTDRSIGPTVVDPPISSLRDHLGFTYWTDSHELNWHWLGQMRNAASLAFQQPEGGEGAVWDTISNASVWGEKIS